MGWLDFLGKLGKLGKLKKELIMTVEQVDERVLELFVNQKYHWKSLLPSQQRAIAVELLRHRCIEGQLYQFIESMVEKEDALPKYRKLLLDAIEKQK
jgi:hypothetical protein